MCLVFLLEPYPMEGMGVLERKRRRTAESIPRGLRHDSPTRLYRSEWWRLNLAVRFLTISTILAGFLRGRKGGWDEKEGEWACAEDEGVEKVACPKPLDSRFAIRQIPSSSRSSFGSAHVQGHVTRPYSVLCARTPDSAVRVGGLCASARLRRASGPHPVVSTLPIHSAKVATTMLMGRCSLLLALRNAYVHLVVRNHC